MAMDEAYINIETPENVAFNYEIAGLGSRFMAALVDSLIIAALLMVLSFIATGVMVVNGLWGPDGSTPTWAWALFTILSFVILWGYYVVLESLWNGQTPGKRWVKLQVVRFDGTPITLTESIIRNIVRLVDFLPASYGIGMIVMFFDPQSRRLGDLAAGTLVILDQTQEATLAALAATKSHSIPLWLRNQTVTENLPVERLTVDELHVVEDLVTRGRVLSNQRQIALQVVKKLFRSMEISPERIPERSPEEWLNMIYLLWKKQKSS